MCHSDASVFVLFWEKMLKSSPVSVSGRVSTKNPQQKTVLNLWTSCKTCTILAQTLQNEEMRQPCLPKISAFALVYIEQRERRVYPVIHKIFVFISFYISSQSQRSVHCAIKLTDWRHVSSQAARTWSVKFNQKSGFVASKKILPNSQDRFPSKLDRSRHFCLS